MAPAFVYLPDDEPDAQMFNGHTFALRPNGTTEFRPFDPSLSEADLVSREWDGDPKDRKPSGVAYVRWKGVSPAVVADHVAGKLAKWGACRTEGPVSDGVPALPIDSDSVAEAERRYLAGTKEWADAVVMADMEKNKARRSAGLLVAESAEVAKAWGWLKSKEGALRAAGLL